MSGDIIAVYMFFDNEMNNISNFKTSTFSKSKISKNPHNI